MTTKGFRIVEQDVEFTHMNTRLEKNGPNEKKNAVDLTMSIQMENDVLDSILPGLRTAFYAKPSKDDIGDLADQGKIDRPIRLKYPALAVQSFDSEWVNYTLAFHYGIDGESDVVLEDCTVKSMKIELHDGGTVDINWKVGAHPTDDQYAVLSERLRTGKVQITLVKAKQVEKQKDLLDNEPVPNPVAAAANDDEVQADSMAAALAALPADQRADAASSLG